MSHQTVNISSDSYVSEHVIIGGVYADNMINEYEISEDYSVCSCEYFGINTCPCCDALEVCFVVHASPRQDKVGTIYMKTSIANVAEFAGCTTKVECEQVAAELWGHVKRAA